MEVIDIPYDTLPEWLSQRSLISTKWLRDLKKIRTKITLAAPELLKLIHQHPTLLPIVTRCSLPTLSDPSGHSTFQTNCLYVDAKEILNILLTKYDTTKSFLGYYKSVLLANWDDIVLSYEKNHLYLAEGARSMVQDCKYEVSALKKSTDVNNKRIVDIQRRLQILKRNCLESGKKTLFGSFFVSKKIDVE
jgi:hypothetical protein